MKFLFLKKNLSKLISDSLDPQIKEGHGGGLVRSLSAFNLMMLGIGAIIGAGIFVLTGTTSAYYAGPGIVYSFIISGILCALAGLCYAEMAAMVPVSGSAYAYSYATLGELIAWIIGWDLILEYAFGAITVSSGWSGYFVSTLTKSFGIHLSDPFILLTKGPWETVTLNDGSIVHGIWNLPASFIPLVVSAVLYKGIKESAFVNNLIVLVKISIIFVFIGLGWGVINSANLFVNPHETGLLALIPEPSYITLNGHETLSFGFNGVLTAAGVIFFSFIGFDAVSTTAQEANNPQRDLPIGILGSLIVCTIIYIVMAVVMTGVSHYTKLGVPDPIAVGVDQIVTLRGWSTEAKHIFSSVIKIGALAGLSSVIISLILGQTRIFYSMSKDGLLPWFSKLHKKYNTPHIATIFTGIVVAIAGGLLPMTLVGELVSIGTLLAFALVCLGVLILRKTQPDIKRPFKVPFVWVIAPLGVISCLWVMSSLPRDTWYRLIIWLVLGFVVYFGFGAKNSLLRKEHSNSGSENTDK